MTSSYTTRLRLNKQGTGDNANTWGSVLNSGVFDLLDTAIGGMSTVALTGNTTLTSANGTTDQSRAAVLKLTTASATYTTTLPAVEKTQLVWNASTAAQTVASAGGGTSISVDSGAIVLAFSDGTNIKTLGYGGLALKDYIDSAILATTGSLPATTGNNGKYILCSANAWTPFTFSATGAVVWAGTSTTAALTPGDTYTALAPVTLTDAATIAVDMSSFINATVTLGGNRTMGNPTNAKPGQSGFIEVVQDGTGSRTLTMGANWKRDGGAPVLSTVAASKDYIFYVVITTSLIIYSFARAPS